MYKPKFNKVLVEIDDKDAQWGKSSESNPLTDAYREGKLLEVGLMIATADYPSIGEDTFRLVSADIDKQIMWHQGHEAGTVFEEDGKKYALIYWWDIIGEKVNSPNA